MLKQIIVENYQSIREADLVLGGITLIVGPNGSGKSALLRALKAAAFNRRGDGFIRDGTDTAQVIIVTSDDQVMRWEKNRGTSGDYWLGRIGSEDHQEFKKTGAGVPELIEQALGIREVQVDKDFKITPQFKMAHDVTILKESGSRMARILGMLTRLHVVVGAQRSARKDRDIEVRVRQTNEDLIAELRPQVEALDWVPLLRQACDHVTALLTPLDEDAYALERGRVIINVDLPFLQARAQRELPTPAQVKHVEQGLAHCEIIRELIRKYNALTGDGVRAATDFVLAEVAEWEARKVYHDACHKAGVCDTCPWK